MRKYRGWTVWPCLCGFDGTIHQIRHHQRTCQVWKDRDVEATKRDRFQASWAERPLSPSPRCPMCGRAGSHHLPTCPGRFRRPRFGPPEIWRAFLKVLADHYEKTGRGAELMAKFDDQP